MKVKNTVAESKPRNVTVNSMVPGHEEVVLAAMMDAPEAIGRRDLPATAELFTGPNREIFLALELAYTTALCLQQGGEKFARAVLGAVADEEFVRLVNDVLDESPKFEPNQSERFFIEAYWAAQRATWRPGPGVRLSDLNYVPTFNEVMDQHRKLHPNSRVKEWTLRKAQKRFSQFPLRADKLGRPKGSKDKQPRRRRPREEIERQRAAERKEYLRTALIVGVEPMPVRP